MTIAPRRTASRWFFFILCASFTLASCSPAQRLARKAGISKRQLEEKLVQKDATGEERLRYGSNGLHTFSRKISALSKDEVLFRRIDKFRTGRFYGPYLNQDSSVYYLRKLVVEEKPYADFLIVQLHQRFGIGDALFQERVDSLLAQSFRAEGPLSTVLKDFPDDDEIGVGTVLFLEQEPLDKLVPAAREFLLTAPVNGVRQAEKVKYPNTTITELIIKRSDIVRFRHIDYGRVTIRKPKEQPK